jgi:PAS domain S-box-containing protein
MKRLLNTTKRLADGDLNARAGPPYKLGEIGQLAYAFDQMTESLLRRETERKRTEEEVIATKARLEYLLRTTPTVIYSSKTAGDYAVTFISENVKAQFGYDPKEFLKDPKFWANRIHPEDAPRIFAELPRLFEQGHHTREYRFQHWDGTYRWIHDEMNLASDQEGNPLEIIGSMTDITEWKWAGEANRQLTDEKKVMAEIGRIISSTLNIEEVYEQFAKEVHKLIEFDRLAIKTIHDEVTGINAYEEGIKLPGRRLGDTFPLAGTNSEEVMRTRKSLLLQIGDSMELGRFPGSMNTYPPELQSLVAVPLISQDRVIGVLHFLSRKANAYKEQEVKLAERVADQIAGALANAQLFLELKRAEEGLRESERRYRLIAENAQDVISTADRNLRMNYVSPSVTRMRGYTVEEVLGQTPEELYTPESLQLMMKVLAEEFAIEKREEKDLFRARSLELEVKCKDGSTYWSETKLTFLHDAAGQYIGILGVGRDITERKRAAKEKAALEEQLRQSQKMEAIGRLAGGIAHDFNNLLTIMKGHSQLALMELKEGDPFREAFEAIEKATMKSAGLVRQLLAFSRRQVMEMIVLDFNSLLRNLEKMLRRIIGEDIELLTVLADDLGRVKADPGQIEQILFNLVVNARDAMPQGGKLTIETANVKLDEAYARNHVAVTPGSYVMLAVSDTGVGMTPEIREMVFEPFFTTKEKDKGTGLGLSTVYGIVKQSGGNIWVYSEPGQGTTFKIYLPRVDEPLTKEREKEESELFRGVGVILVVEDEKMVRKVVLEVLRKQGYSVLEAADEEDALLICQQYKDTIHLMVTDVVMPKISGPELAKRLVVFHPEMKVLYMSGYTDNAIVHHGVLDKGVNFIQKPFTIEGLARKVREVLNKDPKPAI